VPRSRLGIAVSEESKLARLKPGDVDFISFQQTLLDMPRAGAARGLAQRVREQLGQIELIAYAWHYVTHERGDALPGRGSRTLTGDPGAVGHFAKTPEVEEAWASTVRVAEAFGSSHIVLRTPPSFAPGGRGTARLRAFVEAHGADGHRLLWQAEGLWEPERLAALADELEIDVLRPAGSPAPALERAWVGVGVGAPAPRLGDADATDLVEDLLQGSADDPPPLLFGGPEAVGNLRRVRRAWSDLA
jgi:hypothetical protein